MTSSGVGNGVVRSSLTFVSCSHYQSTSNNTLRSVCIIFSVCVCVKQEEPEFSLITGALLPPRPPLTDPERGKEEEEEGTVAVRANMDLALPNSTGQYT